MDTTVLRITPLSDHPQVISTSRHITQGGVDIISMAWDEGDNALYGVSRCVAGEAYQVAVFIPQGYGYAGHACNFGANISLHDNILLLKILTHASEHVSWRLEFKPQ
jgi:hypothetical protein